MAMLLGVLMLAVPVAVVVVLVAMVDRRRAGRQAEVDRQIELTDVLHARLGAVVAPFVRRRGGRWRIAVAVPFERPAVVASVLTAVDQVFARAIYEVVLSRQAGPAAQPRAHRAAPLGKESLSWT
jgi:hypothetical protein